MTKYILFFCTILLMACHQPEKANPFPVPNKDDINAIVKVIIEKDSLAKYKSPLSADLEKFYISNPKIKLNSSIPPNAPNLSVDDLINNTTEYGYFTKRDSSYLLFQNDTIKSLKIDAFLIPSIKLTDKSTQEHDKKAGKFARYIELSIPIFSLDQNTAFVSFDNYCPLCGDGGFFILKKVNGN